MFGSIGMPELVLIFIVALLVFGPKKLPELGKLLGKGLTEFRRAKNELTSTFESHLHELERETRIETTPATSTPDYSSPHYPYPYDEYGQTESNYGSPQETAASHEPVSEPSTASATATQDAEANREHAPEVSSPVAGTVPRSNGSQSVESPSATAKEEHPA